MFGLCNVYLKENKGKICGKDRKVALIHGQTHSIINMILKTKKVAQCANVRLEVTVMKRQFFLKMRGFRDCEAGSASIEALFWIPLFVFFLVLVLDTSFIFYGKAQALRFIQDGNRALSVGALEDTDATAAFIKASLTEYSPDATVITEIIDGIVIKSTVDMPATDLMMIGSIPVFANTMISVTANHFLEQ